MPSSLEHTETPNFKEWTRTEQRVLAPRLLASRLFARLLRPLLLSKRYGWHSFRGHRMTSTLSNFHMTSLLCADFISSACTFFTFSTHFPHIFQHISSFLVYIFHICFLSIFHKRVYLFLSLLLRRLSERIIVVRFSFLWNLVLRVFLP